MDTDEGKKTSEHKFEGAEFHLFYQQTITPRFDPYLS